MRILLFSTIILFSSLLHAQVWTLNKGGYYANISLSSGLYNERYDTTGEVVSLPVEILDRTIELLAQYGVTEKFTLQLNIPYKMISSSGDLFYFNQFENTPYLKTGRLNDLGNIEFGGIYKLFDDKPVVTASFFAEANTSNRNYLTGLQTGFNSWGFQPGLGASWPFTKNWFTFYLGGDIRTNNYSSAVISKFELGYQPLSYVYFAGMLNLKQSVGNGEDCDCTTGYSALYLNNQEFTSFGIKSGFLYKNWGLNVGYNTALTASNMPVTGYVSVGAQYKKVQ